MLLKEEQYVVKWLSQYGALTRTQITRMLKKPPQTAERIVKNLKKQMRAADVGGGYYVGLDSLCRPDQRTILAVWVLLKFIDYVDTMAHYPAVYPSQIFFLKENVVSGASCVQGSGNKGNCSRCGSGQYPDEHSHQQDVHYKQRGTAGM